MIGRKAYIRSVKSIVDSMMQHLEYQSKKMDSQLSK